MCDRIAGSFIDLCIANEPRLTNGKPKTGPNKLIGRFIVQANINSSRLYGLTHLNIHKIPNLQIPLCPTLLMNRSAANEASKLG